MSLGLMQAFPLGRKRIETRSLNVKFIFGTVLLIAAFLSLLYLTQASTVATTGYDIKRLEEEKAQWQVYNEQLRLKIEQLRSLDRVEKEAVARLKMGPPTKLIFLSADIPSKAAAGTGESSNSTGDQGSQGKNSTGWWESLLRVLSW